MSQTNNVAPEGAAKKKAPESEVAEAGDVLGPEAVRALVEQGLVRSQESYEQAKGALEEAVEVLEKTLDEVGHGTVAMNRKVIDCARANLNSGLDLANDLASARNVAEVIELQVGFMRRQFESLTAQAEEIRALATKVASDSAEPLKAHVNKSISSFKLAS